jgi:hypothetical protein
MSRGEATGTGFLIAQVLRQGPVDGVHSIDFQAHTGWDFLLTLKMKGVKTNSFFDTF